MSNSHLLDLLRRADSGESVEISSRFPIAQIVEACTEGRPEQIDLFRRTLEYNADSGSDSLNVVALRNRGLRGIGAMQSIQLKDWPPRLRQWSTAVTKADSERKECDRQADEAKQLSAKTAERARLDAERARQLADRAKAEQANIDAHQRYQAEVDQRASERQAKERDEFASSVAKHLMVQGLIPLQPKKSDTQLNFDEVAIGVDAPIRRTDLDESFEFINIVSGRAMNFGNMLKDLGKFGGLPSNGSNGYTERELQDALKRLDRRHVQLRRKEVRGVVAGDGLLILDPWGGAR